jgi:hypothetical protein
MDRKDAPPAVPPPDTTPAPKYEPLVELRFKPWVFVFVIIVILWTTWFSIFGAIIPYLTTGDFAEIWPAHKHDVFSKAVLFAGSWFWLSFSPFLVGGFRTGVVSLYETHVELRPYLWFFKKLTISYDAMHVTDNPRGMMLNNSRVPKWRESQYNYWKALCLESINISSISMGLSNPEGLPQAFQIIRDRAFKINKSS